MKKQIVTLSVLSVLLMIAASNVKAEEANQPLQARSAVDVLTKESTPAPVPLIPNAINIQNNADHAIWITIYNSFGSIRDSGCIAQGGQVHFNNYYAPLPYKVRAEVTTNNDCSGKVIFDTNTQVGMPITGSGVGISLEKGTNNYYFY